MSLCERHQLTLTMEIGIDRLLPKMARFVSYLVQPDGTLPTLGDTTPGERWTSITCPLARFAEQDRCYATQSRTAKRLVGR
jgi:hypothetical protein